MPEQTPIWRNEGVEPPESLKDNGWEPGMKPSAQHMNWLFNQLSRLAIESGVTVEDILTSVSTENALSSNQGRVINNNLTNLKNQVTAHLDDMAMHNQFMLNSKKQQIALGYNPTLGCLTATISEVIAQ